MGGTWAFERVEGPVGWLHDAGLPVPDRRLVRHAVATAPALVLGSTQPATDADEAAAAAVGVEVVRRRSGGGSVLVEPGETVWLDVCLPRGDSLWDDDVGRAAWWVGEVWQQALADLGVRGATVHRGGLLTTPWSRRVCFAGVGAGEVLVGGAKVVGLSQRRTRAGAVFQTALARSWNPDLVVRCLAGVDPDEASAELAGVAAGWRQLGLDVDADAVVGAFRAALDGYQRG